MRLLRKTQKTAFVSILVLELFITSAFPASAGLFGGSVKVPSASTMATELERRYNFDLGAIQQQAQSFNVADNKKPTPEVSLFFTPSDPKQGEKISAKAFPIYFTNSESDLYYTWTLKRAGCDLTNSPNAKTRALCDRDSDGRITVEDWKVEAASILVQNGFDKSTADYSTSSDDDGYRARYGGDNKINGPKNRCYMNDPKSGVNYELATADDSSFPCPSGTSPVCMVGDGEINPETLSLSTSATGGSGSVDSGSGGSASASASGGVFSFSDNDTCSVSGMPACSAGSSTPICNVGSARCVANPTTTTSCGSALSSCTSTTATGADPYCQHLFPNANGRTSGDGAFGAKEEQFWGTDPKDPDTADNGNKDEANIVGLGQGTFTWNYVAGDMVGVAVEGTSLISTKHADASFMTMWAFSRKDCPIPSQDANTGSYTKTIKGYLVTIPTIDFDLNNCIERNLINPAQGGQSTNLEVAVSATPANPVNDETADRSGDVVVAQATTSNGQHNLSNILFDWKVEISDNIQFNPTIGDTADVTSDLGALGLLSNTKGNALDTVRLKLDMLGGAGTTLGGRRLSAYVNGGSGYLRFTARVTENFSAGIARKGKSDVIVKFTSSGKKISAYTATPVLAGDLMQVALPGNAGLICNQDTLDRTACRVIKNEIIGLKIDKTGLSNFSWTINGAPLICAPNVSSACPTGVQNEINFFPVSGNVGETYTVVVTANDVTTGNTITLTRLFHIVQPTVAIESIDRNIAWPKFLGQYRDITGKADATACPAGLCSDYSTTIFEGFPDSSLGFRAQFMPDFLRYSSRREWQVDGVSVEEGTTPAEIAFTSGTTVGSVHNIVLKAQVSQSDETRRALLDIWNVAPFDTPEINFAVSNQVVLQDPGIASGPFQGERKYLAAIASYVPASVLFTLRILLSAVLVLFTANFLFALLQDRRTRAFAANITGKRF
jgi:hypothetical protein